MSYHLTGSDEEFVAICCRRLLGRAPAAAERELLLERLRAGESRILFIEDVVNSPEFEARFRGSEFAPPGHFYSPIPSESDIGSHVDFDWVPREVAGVHLQEEMQMRTLERLRVFYPTLPFSERSRSAGLRYQYDNPTYSFADGIILHCMIRSRRPKRVIEVGCGQSTCLILDTNELFFEDRIRYTSIEPFPAHLWPLLRPGDRERFQLIEARVQDQSLDLFQQLECGDILFVDSSHVAKLGSDVNFLFFEVLPRLATGVAVHFHDVFYPFEYPLGWYQEGRAWNEQYLLRAFLQFNRHFNVSLMSSFMQVRHRSWFAENMPDCLRNTGGCIWIEKCDPPATSA